MHDKTQLPPAPARNRNKLVWEQSACGLAGRNGLGSLFRKLPGKGTGLVVRGVPGPDLADPLDEPERARLALV